MSTPNIHPAQFPAYMVAPLTDALRRYAKPEHYLLDPFAGLGHRLAEIAQALGMIPIGFEIERGYFDAGATHPCVIQGDALDIVRILAGCNTNGVKAAAIVTSPTYPNGMNDYFRSSESDTSTRNTYVHRLRAHRGAWYEMNENNTGRYNARRGAKSLTQYWMLTDQAIGQWPKVLEPGGVVVLNTKDIMGSDGIVSLHVTDFYAQIMKRHGFRKIARRMIEAPGLRQGSNADQRATHEAITTYRLKGSK